MPKTSGSFSKRAVAMMAVGTFVWGLAGPARAVGGDCGNGTVDVGEECDTGATNGTAGSCCSAACGFEAPTKVCRPATGSCDVAETCTGASGDCPAVDAVRPATDECQPQLSPCDAADFCDGVTKVCPSDFDNVGPDTDGDGACDAADICTDLDGQRGFATGTKARLLLKGTVAMKATAFGTLPAGTTFSDLDPSARAALFEIDRADGTPPTPVLSYTLPTGTFDGFRGWKRNSTGIKWSYVDKTPNALVSRAKIESKQSQAPGRVKITVKGRPMNEAASDDLPLSVVFAFGDNGDSQLGRCLEDRFGAAECRQVSGSSFCKH